MFIMGFKIDISRISLSAKSTYMTFEKVGMYFTSLGVCLYLSCSDSAGTKCRSSCRVSLRETSRRLRPRSARRRWEGWSGIRCSCVSLCCTRSILWWICFNSQTELLYFSSFLAAQQVEASTILRAGRCQGPTLRGVTGSRYLHYVARLFQSRPAPTAQEQFEQP